MRAIEAQTFSGYGGLRQVELPKPQPAKGRVLFVHGEQAGTVAEQVSDWGYAKPARKLFFVTPAGLNVVDNPGP